MLGGRPSSYVLSIAGGLQEYSGNYPLDDEIYWLHVVFRLLRGNAEFWFGISGSSSATSLWGDVTDVRIVSM